MKTAVIQIVVFACLLGLVMPLPDGDQFLDPECGIQAHHRSKRVINGTDMTSSPWTDFLHSQGLLGGVETLITKRLVLTPPIFINLTAILVRDWRARMSRCFGEYCTEICTLDNDIAIYKL